MKDDEPEECSATRPTTGTGARRLRGCFSLDNDRVYHDQLRTFSPAGRALVSTVLARHIAYLEAELREARRKLQAAKVEEGNERDRVAPVAIKVAQVDPVNVVVQTQPWDHSPCRARTVGATDTPPNPARVTPHAIAPDGTILTMANLPSPDTKRWVPSRKAILVAAVRVGILSLQEACRRYRLTEEEFGMWQFQVGRHGLAGLRTSKGQLYRRTLKRARLAGRP